MTICQVMMMLIGKGGMSVGEAKRLKDFGLIQLIINGHERRDHIAFEAARVIIQPWCKEPVKYPWDNDTLGPEKTEEQLQAEFDAAKPMFEKMLSGYVLQQQSELNNGKE